MNRAQLVASLAKWQSRERFRRLRWRRYVKTRPVGHASRDKWFKLYTEAHENVRRRRTQLSRLPVTCLDNAGIEHLIREEGVRNEPYNDSAGHCTVGVGHLLHRGRCTGAERSLSDAEIRQLLRKDIARFEREVRKAFTGKGALIATQARFNACVSLAFNIGQGGFATSSVKRRIQNGDLKGAADAFLLWNHPPELGPRRKRERSMFLEA